MSKARGLADLGNAYSDGALSNRNLIINGAMQVAQRGTSFTDLGTAPTYTLDRWRFADSANPPARYTATQSSDAPSGFASSLKYEVTTEDAAVDADEIQNVDYFIEAQDLQQLDYGSSGAKDITLSFWVKCSVAQNFGFRIQHEDGGGGYTKSYAVNSANTWEYKTLTFSGNTATNFANDNGRGFRLRWGLIAGTDYTGSDSTAWGNGDVFGLQENTWVATLGATWQITGVQLEVGDTATPFEHRSYGDELSRCQRYYEWGIASGSGYGQISAIFDAGSTSNINFKATKRAVPTMTNMTLSANAYPNNQNVAVPRYEGGYARNFRYTSENSTTFWNVVTGNGGTTGIAGHQIVWNAEAEL